MNTPLFQIVMSLLAPVCRRFHAQPRPAAIRRNSFERFLEELKAQNTRVCGCALTSTPADSTTLTVWA